MFTFFIAKATCTQLLYLVSVRRQLQDSENLVLLAKQYAQIKSKVPLQIKCPISCISFMAVNLFAASF